MAFIRSASGSGGGVTELPQLTFLGGQRAVYSPAYTFTQAYSNICVITYSDSNSFTSITSPTGSECTEIGVVPSSIVTNAPKQLRVFDIHNVASGTTVQVTWDGWCSIAVFSY